MEKVKTLLLYTTNRCNLSCAHCFYHKDLNIPKEQLTVEQIENIVRAAKPWGITLCGGEPTLRDDLVEVCKVLDKNGVKRIGIMTNGLLFKKIPSLVEGILKGASATINVNMSLDGLEETHNKIRKNKLAFKTVVETTKRLKPFLKKYKNFQMCLRTVVMASNYKQLEELSLFIDKELRVPHFFELVRGINLSGVPEKFANMPYNPEDKDLFLKEEYIKKLESIFARIFYRRGKKGFKEFIRQASQYHLYVILMRILKNKRQVVECAGGKGAGVIYPDGAVALCEYMKPVGKLSENNFDFNKVWTSDEANDQRKIIPGCYCTHGCFVSGCVFDKKLKSPLNRIKSGIKLFIDYHLKAK